MSTPALLLAVACGLVVVGAALWARGSRWGAAGLAAAAVALLGAAAALLGRRGPPPGPPPPPPGDRARRTAGDILAERAAADRSRVVDAAGDPDALADEMRRQR